MNYLISNIELEPDALARYSKTLLTNKIGNVYLYYEEPLKIHENDQYIALLQGYVNDLSLDIDEKSAQNHSFFQGLSKQWPLPDQFTGSFAVSLISKTQNSIILCNDLIGIYPLHYHIQDNNFYISTSIIMLGSLTDAKLDEVGIVQRSIGRELSHLASRTLLKDVKRLLPGEKIILDTQTLSTQKMYDNTLYQNVEEDKPITKSDLQQYWQRYQKEVTYATRGVKETYLALSGGMDSRILMGALPANQSLNCVTYGAKDNYETKVAARLAAKKQHDFQSYDDLTLLFPPKETLKEYAHTTEALNIANWLQILEPIKPAKDAVILLGDMCEVLPARNIKAFSSRKARVNAFWRTQILNKPFELTESTPAHFDNWKRKIVLQELMFYSQDRVKQLAVTIDYKLLLDEVQKDFEELFNRIAAHQLPYVELYDELFNWYTHARVPMGKQVLLCNYKFDSICPPMSMGILRASSNLHPNRRLNYRFMNQLFKQIAVLKPLNSIPTNQSPLVSRNAPGIIIFLMWGIRFFIDYLLIRRLMKKKNPNLRYRWFKGMNWVKVYQNAQLEERIEKYFQTNHIGEWVNVAKKLMIERKQLKKWPLANFDFISLATLNIELDCIKNRTKEVR